MWKKWVLFLCAPPLAVAGNLARIIMLTIGTVAFGSEFALGKNPLENPSWFHLAAGYLVFLVALCGMMGVGWLLSLTWKSSSIGSCEESKVGVASTTTDRQLPGSDVY